ncbi:MAG: phosphoribosylformylglycinamidine synthase subunit PurL, partial [Actinobacteria bacterium]|nr:phosphoribosylformylglycinamidine synthase subunit PurL [Actinomycetota bacterium]
LTDVEFADIKTVLGRDPNPLELALFGVMWSEHCSYKSSRIHLKRLPTEGPTVLVGPGENAGVVDAGDGIAVAIRIESHNHPSAIEPHQGAATGVGGILRDIFTMGARPLAVMDPLFFGEPNDARQRWLVDGVVSGISNYGNSVGVPTVGGELTFDRCYQTNPLVNVLCVGALPVERLVLGQASGTGNLAVLLGSSTGRDGIGGVSVLASAGFDGADGAASLDDAKRPSVQVGDPYEEKRLIEACLALLDDGLVIGIQDLGGAGLACATSETAARGRVGMDVDVTAIPRREPGMEPWEVMTSESQERMLAIVTPESLPKVEELCARWEVNATVIGKVTEPEKDANGEPIGQLRIRNGFDGEILADVPAAALADEAPLYERPLAEPKNRTAMLADDPTNDAEGLDANDVILSLVTDPAMVYRQYDHQLFLNTVIGPGADAALLRLAGPGLPVSSKGMALSTDSNPRWCALDPRRGTAATVAEGMANVACTGASAVAVVNCLNFGNPEHPEVMWQLSEAVDGMSEACLALGLPVIGGNVSLYNESAGVDIDPTPVIGTLALLEELVARPPSLGWSEGESVVLLGAREASGTIPFSLAGTQVAVDVMGRRCGTLFDIDYATHAATCALISSLVGEHASGKDGLLGSVHDVGGGGLGVALAEMAIAGNVGASLSGVHGVKELFCEHPGRFVVTTNDVAALQTRANEAGVALSVLGTVGGTVLSIESLVETKVSALSERSRSALSDALDAASR